MDKYQYRYMTIRYILSTILLVLAVLGIVSCAQQKPDSDWHSVDLKYVYKVGSIATWDGNNVAKGDICDDDTALYTPDLILCTGFRVTRDADDFVKYLGKSRVPRRKARKGVRKAALRRTGKRQGNGKGRPR